MVTGLQQDVEWYNEGIQNIPSEARCTKLCFDLKPLVFSLKKQEFQESQTANRKND